METIYINDKRFDYESISISTGLYHTENGRPLYKTGFDAWYITGIKYINSEYFGQFNNLKDLKESVEFCIQNNIF